MTEEKKSCRCGEIYCGDYGDEMCVDGIVYGPCQVQECGGCCEETGSCLCDCHGEEAA